MALDVDEGKIAEAASVAYPDEAARLVAAAAAGRALRAFYVRFEAVPWERDEVVSPGVFETTDADRAINRFRDALQLLMHILPHHRDS